MYKSRINRVLFCIIQFAINKSTKKAYLLMNYGLILNKSIILFNSIPALITYSIPAGEWSIGSWGGVTTKNAPKQKRPISTSA